MRREHRARCGIAGIVLAFVALWAQAQVPHEFRRVLALMSPADRARLQAQAQAWSGWSRAERGAFAQRAAAWDAVPLAERRLRRESWQAWSALDDAARARLRAEASRVAAMAPAERDALRARFERLDLTTRRGWMLGPVLGTDYARLQPLLAHVPLDQQAGLLRTLRVMTPVQRADLAVLVQRTPPAERDALRRALVSTSDANRDAWLRLSLER